jgi:VanZ family protein
MNSAINKLMQTGGFWYALLAAYLAVLGFLSLNPWVRPASREGVFSPDKIDHGIAYAGLTIIVYFCLACSRAGAVWSKRDCWIASILASACFGIFIEIAQSAFTSNRAGSVDDAVANAIGGLIGYGVWRTVSYLRAMIRE